MPGGIPRWVRCYDNGGETFDRYTVVFTKKRQRRGGIIGRAAFLYVAMSANPYHPQGFGQHGESDMPIDRPTYGHLGKRIRFEDLPDDCKTVVIEDYMDIFGT